jgi:hypothetical protein
MCLMDFFVLMVSIFQFFHVLCKMPCSLSETIQNDFCYILFNIRFHVELLRSNLKVAVMN